MFEGFIEVDLEAPEEFLVVGSSFSHQLLGHLLGPLLLVSFTCRVSLRHLVLDKGLLGLDLAPMLSSQIGGAPEKEIGHLTAFLVEDGDSRVRRWAVRCGPPELTTSSGADSLHLLLVFWVVSCVDLLTDGDAACGSSGHDESRGILVFAFLSEEHA